MANVLGAAIDFGLSNTDAVAQMADSPLSGARGEVLQRVEWRRWTRAYVGEPDAAMVRSILDTGGIGLEELDMLAATGGRHRLLPPQIGRTRIVGVNEVPAIGRGGQAALAEMLPGTNRRKRILVVSAGSGTAVIAAQGKRYKHYTGTAVGGGTMLGLARLLLGSVDPVEIDRLACAGDANAVDLSLADVVTGPIGSLPATATAVNFGRLAREPLDARREDMAAALITLIGQVIGLLSIAAAKALQCEHIVVIGHMTDMQSIRRVIELVSHYYSTPIDQPAQAGYYTAVGALLHAQER